MKFGFGSSTEKNGVPRHMLGVKFHASAGTPPSLGQLARWSAEHGFGDLAEGAKSLERQQPGYKPADKELMDWGTRLEGAGREADALAVLQLNTELHPENFLGFHLLGDAFERNGDKAQAIKAFHHAVKLEPGDTDALQRLKQLEAAAQ